jgi:membrane-bound metal-dependent hydrolase YbcI (DUF457 family)
MFIGHYAVALWSRRSHRLPPLWLLFIAVQLLDLLWPVLVLLGIETFEIQPGNTKLTPLNFTYYPWSHSLLMAILWGLVLGLMYYFVAKNKSGSTLLFILVVSHWILDYLTHRPDLQLSPFSGKRVGLGLWNHPALEIALELTMFMVAAVVYFIRIHPPRKVSFCILVVLFIVIHLVNALGPPPPSVTAVAWSANLMWLFILWAWWIEKPKKIKLRS